MYIHSHEVTLKAVVCVLCFTPVQRVAEVSELTSANFVYSPPRQIMRFGTDHDMPAAQPAVQFLTQKSPTECRLSSSGLH